MAKKPKKRPEVERRIYFFRADLGRDESGRPIPVDFGGLFAVINGLSFPSGDRYQEADGTTSTCCWIDRSRSPYRFRAAIIRRAGLPQLEGGNGRLTPLSIPDGAGLAEQTHAVVFRRTDGSAIQDVVAVEFNFHGPRANRIAHYLGAKGGVPFHGLRLHPILKSDVLRAVRRLEGISLLRLKIREPYLATIQEADKSLADAFKASLAASGGGEVEIVLSPKAYSRSHLSDRLRRRIESLAKLVSRSIAALPDADSSGAEDIRKFVVRGTNKDTGQKEEVDILSELIAVSKRMVRLAPRSRALDSESVFASIEEAYGEVQHEIAEAPALEE